MMKNLRHKLRWLNPLRRVVFSNNGHVGNCPLWMYGLAVVFNKFRSYDGLRIIGIF